MPIINDHNLRKGHMWNWAVTQKKVVQLVQKYIKEIRPLPFTRSNLGKISRAGFSHSWPYSLSALQFSVAILDTFHFPMKIATMAILALHFLCKRLRMGLGRQNDFSLTPDPPKGDFLRWLLTSWRGKGKGYEVEKLQWLFLTSLWCFQIATWLDILKQCRRPSVSCQQPLVSSSLHLLKVIMCQWIGLL